MQSDAELRVITVKTEAGDIVKYSGNPAALPGARYETTKALRRAGAFTLLVEHNASRLKNRTIAVDDVNNTFHSSPRGRLARRSRSSELHFREAVPGHFETDQRAEPSAHGERRASIHGSDQHRRNSRQAPQLAIPNKHEVSTEALAYTRSRNSAFSRTRSTQTSFSSRATIYDGSKLKPLFDQIEALPLRPESSARSATH